VISALQATDPELDRLVFATPHRSDQTSQSKKRFPVSRITDKPFSKLIFLVTHATSNS
jgi:hypothetical protein